MEFRNWILETFTPVVMVVASAEAEALVAEDNGLTIVDMLRPYGYFHHLSGTGPQSRNLQHFKQRQRYTRLLSRLCNLNCSSCAHCWRAVLPHQGAQASLFQLSKHVLPER